MLPSDVVAYGASLFGYTVEDVHADRRPPRLCRARFAIYMGLALRTELAGGVRSTVRIGRIMRRDHATIHYGLRRASEYMETDAKFAAAVHKIATVTLAQFEKETCKAPLHPVPQANQQRRSKKMDHPEYVEDRINDILKARKQRELSVYWTGAVIERGTPNCFDVYYDDDPTGFCVFDDGRRLTLERVKGRQYTEFAEVRTYEDIARELIDIVPATIKDEEREEA